MKGNTAIVPFHLFDINNKGKWLYNVELMSFSEERVNLRTTHLCQSRPIPEYSVLPCTSGPSSRPKSELKANYIFPANGLPGSTGNAEDIADHVPSGGHPLRLSFPLDGVDSTSFDIYTLFMR